MIFACKSMSCNFVVCLFALNISENQSKFDSSSDEAADL